MVFCISALVTRGADIIGSITKGIERTGAGAWITGDTVASATAEVKYVSWVGVGVYEAEGVGSTLWLRSGAVIARVIIGALEVADLVACAMVRLTPYICCEVLTIGGGIYVSEAGSVEALDIGKTLGGITVLPVAARTLGLLPSWASFRSRRGGWSRPSEVTEEARATAGLGVLFGEGGVELGRGFWARGPIGEGVRMRLLGEVSVKGTSSISTLRSLAAGRGVAKGVSRSIFQDSLGRGAR